MTEETNKLETPRTRKRDYFRELFSWCFGKRKPNRGKDRNNLLKLPAKHQLGADTRRNGSLESLPPILLLPTESRRFNDSQAKSGTIGVLPTTEEGAVVLHQGYGSKQVKELYFSRDLKRTSDSLTGKSVDEAKRRVNENSTNALDPKGNEPEGELCDWDKRESKASSSVDSCGSIIVVDGGMGEMMIELPMMKGRSSR